MQPVVGNLIWVKTDEIKKIISEPKNTPIFVIYSTKPGRF